MLGLLLLATLPAVIAQCPSDYVYGGSFNKCYGFFNTPVSFNAAETYCVSRGGHLTSVLNAFENNFVTGLASAYLTPGSTYWIGLNAPYNNSQWRWTDGYPFSYNNFVFSNLGSCVYIYGSNWGSQDCTVNYRFVCEIFANNYTVPTTRAPGHCQSSWSYFGQTDSCYKVFDVDRSSWIKWDPAEQHCVAQGGHLASIHSDDENDFVAGVIGELDPWIGLTKPSTVTSPDKGWYWTDGSPVNYTKWFPNSPNSYTYCAFLDNTKDEALWDNGNCNYVAAFVCKKPAQH